MQHKQVRNYTSNSKIWDWVMWDLHMAQPRHYTMECFSTWKEVLQATLQLSVFSNNNRWREMMFAREP
eukprot:15113502-Ditylum_brightwellii.AAC.1